MSSERAMQNRAQLRCRRYRLGTPFADRRIDPFPMIPKLELKGGSMIRNETQYQATVARLEAFQRQLICEREQFRRAGIADTRIEQFVGKLMSDCEMLEEEIATYRMRTSRTWVPA